MPSDVNIYFGAFCDEDINKRVFHYIDNVHRWDRDILERAFELFNAPLEYLEDDGFIIASRYRGEKLRSLSVGDVVEIDKIKYLCEGVGWRKLKKGELDNSTPGSHHRACPHVGKS
jgi:hypothetical protein